MDRATTRATGAQLKGKRVAILATGLVTSRKPEDIPAFNQQLIEAIAERAPSARMDRNTAET